MAEREESQIGTLEEEWRKFLQQAEALANALGQKLEEEVAPKLEKAAQDVQRRLEEMDWEKLERDIQVALHRGLVKARQALEKALANVKEGKAASTAEVSLVEEEHLAILRMVAEGKLSPEEAAKLLEALGD